MSVRLTWSKESLVCCIAILFLFCRETPAQIPDNVHNEYFKTVTLLGEGKYDLLIARNKNLIERFPTFWRLYEKQTSAFYYSNQLEQGENFFLGAIKSNPGNAGLFYGLGLLYHLQQKYSLAVAHFAKSITLPEPCPEAYLSLVSSAAADSKLDSARSYFNDILKKNSSHFYAHLALGYLYQLESQWQKSALHLDKCIEMNPNLWRGYFLRSRLEVVSGNYKQALTYLEKASELVQSFNDLEIRAKIDARHATILSSLGELAEADEYFERALSVFKQFGMRRELAAGLNNYGTNLSSQGKYLKAIPIFEQAKSEYEAVQFKKGVGFAYGNIGEQYAKMGYFSKAIEFFHQALKIARETEDINFERMALSDIGENLRALGNYSEALRYFFNARNVNNALTNKWVDADIMQKLGGIYADLGNYDKALRYYDQSVKKFQETGDELKVALNLGLLAGVHYKNDDLKSSFQRLEESLEISNRIGDPEITIANLLQLGQFHLENGNTEQALRDLKKSLAIAKASDHNPKIALSLVKLGECFFALDKPTQALKHYNSALAISEKNRLPQIAWQAYRGIAKSHEVKNLMDDAIKNYSYAVDILDSLESTTVKIPFYTDFLKDKIEVYTTLIQLLARQKKYEQALQLSENMKSGIFASGNFTANVSLMTTIPDSLRIALLDLESKLSLGHKKLSEEFSKTESFRNQNTINQLESEISNLASAKNQSWKKIKERHSEFSDLLRNEPISIQKVQNELVDDKKAVVIYLVGEEKVSTFVLTQNEIRYLEIPISKDSLYRAFRNISPKFRDDWTRRDKIDLFVNAREVDFKISLLHQFYQLIFKPLEVHLHNIEQLTIIPSDVLNYLPFEMLVTSADKAEHDYDFVSVKFLLEKYSISYTLSLNLLGGRERELSRHTSPLIAFGNPGFEASRFQSDDLPSTFSPAANTFNLPFIEKEVKGISEILDLKENKIYTGKAAQEEVIKSRAQDFQIIHLATHSIVNDWEPLYSKLILARHETGTEDGYLQTYEIFNLNLNADLVVLSACNTGTGRLKRGEGLTSLARAFLCAGSKSLVASLWNVNDNATSVIQENFYRNLKNNLKKNTALQKAKIDYINSVDSPKADPFYWAPFILIGSTDSIEFVSRSSVFEQQNVYILSFILLALLSFGYLIRLKTNRTK